MDSWNLDIQDYIKELKTIREKKSHLSQFHTTVSVTRVTVDIPEF